MNYNIEAVSNEVGAVVEWYQISPFGQVKIMNGLGDDITETGSRVSNRHFMQGRDYDFDIDAYYYRMRWMSPTMGRFISRDPMRFGAGDINLYRFVGNNPFGGLDPLGLREWDIKATIGVMLGLGFDVGYEEKVKDCPCKDAQSWFLKFTANAKAGAKAQIDYIVGSESVEGGSLTGGTSAFINVDCDGEASGGGCIEITGGVGYTATSSLFGFKEKNSVANVKETVSYCIKNRGDDIRFEISVCTSFDPYSVTPSVLGVSPGSIGLPKSKNCEVIFGGTFRKRQ